MWTYANTGIWVFPASVLPPPAPPRPPPSQHPMSLQAPRQAPVGQSGAAGMLLREVRSRRHRARAETHLVSAKHHDDQWHDRSANLLLKLSAQYGQNLPVSVTLVKHSNVIKPIKICSSYWQSWNRERKKVFTHLCASPTLLKRKTSTPFFVFL